VQHVRDVMTKKVVAVHRETPVKAIAHLLLEHGISAVPVLSEDAIPIGMVSEGDLMPRNESERQQRRDWWLQMLAEGQALSADYLKHIESDERTAGDVMITPTITIAETADLVEAAELMSKNRIKRLPVVRACRIVGIISRADLVRAVARPEKPDPVPSLDAAPDIEFPPLPAAPAMMRQNATAASSAAAAGDDEISANALRALVEDFERQQISHRSEQSHDLLERRRQEAMQIIAAELSEDKWAHFLRDARAAARRGETEYLLVRFPCEVCTDHGRAINAPDPSWPETLRGLPARIFLRWKDELRPRGFVLHARVMEFIGGMPGDIGLFLAWG
jgi:CBS domain-containing protein